MFDGEAVGDVPLFTPNVLIGNVTDAEVLLSPSVPLESAGIVPDTETPLGIVIADCVLFPISTVLAMDPVFSVLR
ncbi:unnamed protein product [Rotaria socialis]|uniref:Uncharacterized protein n=1 Tax=Rotaria socialis TaxID=392032 RepID=A0A821YAF9_9BILA|nr:unnamed protein product [Rotaria socialis]